MAVVEFAGDAGAVPELAAAVASADGVAAFSEQTLLNVLGPGSAAPLSVPQFGVFDGDALIGYAQLDAGSAELAVHPDYRRRGIGAALLGRMLDAGARVWAHGPHPGAVALAAKADLVVVRELWLMTARVRPPAPLPPDETIAVDTFDAERDGDDWVAVNAAAFADHPEQGRMVRADLDARMAEPWFDPAGFWVARDAHTGDFLGSMWTKVAGQAPVAEIYVLGVAPAAQGRGLGTRLTSLALEWFSERGIDDVELYVEATNAAAIATYQRAGFARARADVQYARPT